MNEDIECQLRRALRPVEPPPGFAERVLHALPAQARRPVVAPVVLLRAAPTRPASWKRLSAPLAMAASLLVAILVGQHVGSERQKELALREQRAGLAASRELMQALRVTSKKLDLAYQAVKTPPEAEHSTEENRS
jgi:hypothetical protein